MSTENEKLRALLAEAGDRLVRIGVCDDDLLDRIDAALAEPVEVRRVTEALGEPATVEPQVDQCIGCSDNSCIFKVLSPGGMGTNGGCRCFENLVSWSESEKRWNRPEVRRVERAARMLSQRVHKTERERDEARAEVERLRDKALRFDLDQAGIESRERDAVALVEARAEVARLKSADFVRGLLRANHNYAEETERLWAENSKLRGEACGAVPDATGKIRPCGVCVGCAYQRGAEAMREAAARASEFVALKCRAALARPEESMTAYGADECARVVRALPLPKETA